MRVSASAIDAFVNEYMSVSSAQLAAIINSFDVSSPVYIWTSESVMASNYLMFQETVR